MDKKVMYVATVYAKDGRRLEFVLCEDLKGASIRGRAGALFFGDEATYKVWNCTETEPNFKEA